MPSLVTALSSILMAILAGLALLHIYWACGGRAGAADAVPSDQGRPVLQPGPLACTVVAVALLLAAALVALRAELLHFGLPAWLARSGVLGVGLLFAARAIGDRRYVGFFKSVRNTVFARRDSYLYSPLCLVISLLAVAVALLPA